MSIARLLQVMLHCCRPIDGPERDVMKNPVEGSKASFPGGLAVKEVGGVPVVLPEDAGLVADSENLLQTVYDHGPVKVCTPLYLGSDTFLSLG